MLARQPERIGDDISLRGLLIQAERFAKTRIGDEFDAVVFALAEVTALRDRLRIADARRSADLDDRGEGNDQARPGRFRKASCSWPERPRAWRLSPS